MEQCSLEIGLEEQLLAKIRDCFKLVNGRVWFESQTCRGWLQGYLCEVCGLKAGHIWGYVTHYRRIYFCCGGHFNPLNLPYPEFVMIHEQETLFMVNCYNNCRKSFL